MGGPSLQQEKEPYHRPRRMSDAGSSLSRELSELILELMKGIHNRSSGDTLVLLYKHNLTLPQLVALHILDEEPLLTIGSLAERLHLSVSATSHLVDTLVEKRMVIREEDPSDRRRKKVRLGVRGKALIERIAFSRSQEFIRYFESVPEDLRGKFEEVLRPLVEALKRFHEVTERNS